jgi:hypothetical protein
MKGIKPVKYISAALVAVVIFALILPFQVCRDWAFICKNTGSQKGYRAWFLGLKTGHWYKKSKLEEFMETKYPNDLTYRWISYAGTGKNILGRAISFGHGRPGPIIYVPYNILNWYVSNINNDEKRALYDVFASGDKQRIDKEISMIWEQYLNLPDEKIKLLDSTVSQ